MPNRTKIFISYSHKDQSLLAELVPYLEFFETNDVLSYWVDDKIPVGGNWEQEIGKALDETIIAVLLVSQSFLTSHFIMKTEVPQILELSKDSNVTVFPVIIRDCLFKESVLAQFQAFNDPSKPISHYGKSRREKEWKDLALQVSNMYKDNLQPNQDFDDLTSLNALITRGVERIRLSEMNEQVLTYYIIDLLSIMFGFNEGHINFLTGENLLERYDERKAKDLKRRIDLLADDDRPILPIGMFLIEVVSPSRLTFVREEKIDQVIHLMKGSHVEHAVIFATGKFTANSIERAKQSKIQLIDGEELVSLFRQYKFNAEL